jgi:rhodanese-related sulfurtransferase
MSTHVKLQLPFEVKERLKQGEKFEILDVRELEEWASGHIPEARHIPLGELEARHKELTKDQEIVVVCRSGNRSGIACQYLSEMGYKAINMPGGMSAWQGNVVYGE